MTIMPKQRQLTKAELAKPYSKYYDRPMTPPPQEIFDFLARGPIDPKNALPFTQRNELLKSGYLSTERGWCVMPDGTAFVAGLTLMPGVSAEMIAWWFVWHGLESLRYMIWDPDDHYAVYVRDEHLERRLNDALSITERNWNTTDMIYEDIGDGAVELSTAFMSPADFGYDMDLFEKEKVLIAVSAVSGAPVFGDKPVISFSHVGRAIPGGIELRSRFWLGWAMVDGKPTRASGVSPQVFEKIAGGLVYHCPKEFYNLAAILPGVFAENSWRKDNIEDFR
jgi:phloretin hydrolase